MPPDAAALVLAKLLSHVISLSTKNIRLLVAAALSFITAGCGWIYNDPQPCRQSYKLTFVYDYNMLGADAFNKQVKAVDVWAFYPSGEPAWHGKASGEALSNNGFSMDVDLAPGDYQFLCWGGIVDGSPYVIGTDGKSGITSFDSRLSTDIIGGNNVSSTNIPPLFHGLISAKLEEAVDKHVDQTVVMPLMRDTKSVTLVLQNVDGAELDAANFRPSIIAQNLNLAYDNQFLPSETVEYRPWNTDNVWNSGARDGDTSLPAAVYNFSTNRLQDGANVRLSVLRVSDNKEIINIPLIDYLLLVKGSYGNMGDQEFLDRLSEYSLMFFLDNNNNWNLISGIYVNGWAVVPPQETGQDL